ncbi:GNAT family N-acetyltransferase [Bradyrhizobium sp.]|uniref:GNAT family N-acetyltransferase n=1 Tax=Bradyrhizobium sp. TaxID=376 RepID=UPI003C70B8BD
MIAPLKPAAALAHIHGPVIETERLLLRPWRGGDIAPNTAMLSDPGTARFITADGKPVTDALVGWRNAAIMAGHWVLYGAGMFVVEEKASGKFTGRVGPWFPPGWPGFEVGWGIAAEFRGKGYALEAAQASIDWVFATFEIDQIIHCIDRENVASQGVARRLGASKVHETDLFGHAADVWVTRRDRWSGLTH